MQSSTKAESLRHGKVCIVGILNLTPDSFSDGDLYTDPASACARAQELLRAGAELLDLGADSTRPGSLCCGIGEECRRLRSVLAALPAKTPFFVDTHHAQTAELALDCGALGINDVSAGSDPGMFELVAARGAKIVLMYSRCTSPHSFGAESDQDLIPYISAWLLGCAEKAQQSGILRGNIILDPGMGAFISSDPLRSLELIERWSEFSNLGYDLMLGISRKGFVAPQLKAHERDHASLELTKKVTESWPGKSTLYLRVHEPALYRDHL